jgi:hypothetical protein
MLALGQAAGRGHDQGTCGIIPGRPREAVL